MIGIIMFGLAMLSLVSARMALNLSYPDNVNVQSSNQALCQIVASARRLTNMRSEIEKMPDGFDKMKAKQLWLKELDTLLANSTQSEHNELDNIIQLRQFQR